MATQTKQINPLLQAYLTELVKNPLRTKAITSGVVAFFSEIAAGHLSGVLPPALPKSSQSVFFIDWIRRNVKPFKLFVYGALISAPLGHFLHGKLQSIFAGKTSPLWKIAMIVTSNLCISPIQQLVYLISMSLINGISTVSGIKRVINASFMRSMKLIWIISPLAMLFAQTVLGSTPELWVPFFTLVGAVVGTTINTMTKKAGKKLADAKRLKDEKKNV